MNVFVLVILMVKGSSENPRIDILRPSTIRGTPYVDVDRFNSLVSEYFWNLFGNNGIKYLEFVAEGRCKHTSNKMIRSEVNAIIEEFGGGLFSLFHSKKSTHEIRYRVHRLVGILDYIGTFEGCTSPPRVGKYDEMFWIRKEMNTGVSSWLKHVRKGSSNDDFDNIVVLCLQLTGMLVWYPRFKESHVIFFSLLAHAMEEAASWCFPSPTDVCLKIKNFLTSTTQVLGDENSIEGIWFRFKFYYIGDPNPAKAIFTLRTLLDHKVDCEGWNSENNAILRRFKVAALDVAESIDSYLWECYNYDCPKFRRISLEKLTQWVADFHSARQNCDLSAIMTTTELMITYWKSVDKLRRLDREKTQDFIADYGADD